MLGSLTAFLILAARHLRLPAWVAALIVTAVWGVVAGPLPWSGESRLKRATPPVPEQTVETVKEDVAVGEDPDAIREDIEQTREQMGETVDALGYKADVKRGPRTR